MGGKGRGRDLFGANEVNGGQGYKGVLRDRLERVKNQGTPDWGRVGAEA